MTARLVAVLLALLCSGITAAQPTEPVYVGVRVCARCHSGAGMGNQFSVWFDSAHSRAYAALARPEAREIARRSGIREDPQTTFTCLGCHSSGAQAEPWQKDETFHVKDGIQCESCHGPGSEYMSEQVMRDPTVAMMAGLRMPDEQWCMRCHKERGSHDAVLGPREFDPVKAMARIAHPQPVNPVMTGTMDPHDIEEALEARIERIPPPGELPEGPAEPLYKTPLNLALSPDAKQLFVTCSGSDSVVVVDPASRTRIGEISVGGQPHGVAFTPDGKRAFVSNMFDDTISVIDVAGMSVTRTVPVGDEPHGVLVDRQGRYLYVLNAASDDIYVLDAQSLQRVKTLSASRRPWAVSMSPDGSQIYVSHVLSRFVPFRTPSLAEVTAIDTGRAVVTDRPVLPGANLLMGIDWHPSGEFALVTMNRTKNLVPMTRLLQGWTITNGLGIVWKDGTVDQVLLDEPDVSFPDPTGRRHHAGRPLCAGHQLGLRPRCRGRRGEAVSTDSPGLGL